MSDRLINSIVIVGGGTAGWMCAAALSKVLRGRYRIVLVESDEIGTVGVGEATIPHIRTFNELLEINENEFIRATQGSFKLGIEFVDWGKIGDRYIHGFGRIGQNLWTIGFEQYWQRMHRLGKAPELSDYCINHVASRRNKFMRPSNEVKNSPLNEIAYAFHFDAGLYARFLRKFSEQRGVERVEGRIVDVALHGESGHITSVKLASGTEVEGELFLDCSGFRGLLIEQTLRTGFEDWTHWLPCDRAIAVPCEPIGPLLPYTRSTAHRAGWQWRIPLQHRIGNGHVFSSQHMSVDEATAVLLANLDGRPTAEPRTLKFATGRRRLAWNKNCIAVGLASGFIEPLESTSIHLVQTMIARLMVFFPDRGFSAVDIAEFNREAQFEYERIRDFIILHYHATQRDDSDFWRSCRNMAVPDTLRHKMDMYQSHGRIFRDSHELFADLAWLQVMHGQGLRARSYHPLADLPGEGQVEEYLASVKGIVSRCVDVMPDHAAYIAKHCAATPI
jgi:tryptophan halogenase